MSDNVKKFPPVMSEAENLGTVEDNLVTMEREDQVIRGNSALNTTSTLIMEATHIRQDKFGVHATVSLKTNRATLAHDSMNIGKDGERTRLSNTAARRLGNQKEWSEPVKQRLDQFCERVWQTWLATEVSEWSDGAGARTVQRLLSPYVLAEAGTIVFGRKGRGKSWLGIFWAMCLHNKIDTEWWKIPEPIPTLFVNLERGRDSVNARVAKARKVLGAPGMRSFHARGRTIQNVYESLRREIKKNGIQCLIVDSLSRAGTGSLVADDDTNQAMDILNSLGVAWVALGHTARGDEGHLFGSVMQENAADVMVAMQGVDSILKPHSIGCRLSVTAANDIAKPPDVTYALDFDSEEGLLEIRQPQPGEFPDLAVDGESALDEIVALLDSEGSATLVEIMEAGGLSRSATYEILKMPIFTRVKGGRGRGKVAQYALAARPGTYNEELDV